VIEFIGLDNYKHLFTNIIQIRFRQEFINSLFYTLFLLVGTNVIGLVLAIMLDRTIKFSGFFKTFFLYPLALSFIVSGTIWRWLLAPKSGINMLPTFLGFKPFAFKWISSRESIINFNWQNVLQGLFAVLALVLITMFYMRIRHKLYRNETIYNKIVTIALFLFFGIITALYGWSILIRTIYISAIVLFVMYFIFQGIKKEGVEKRLLIYSGLSFFCVVYVYVLHDSLPQILDYEEQHGFNLATIGIIIAGVWQYSGYIMALYLAGLQSLPVSIRESAKIDGANEFVYYWKIAIPNLKPITLSAIIILAHISLKMFDLLFSMAGPDNINTSHPSINMYLTSFSSNNFGLGVAIAMITFILSALLIIPYLVYSYKTRT
jgi:glucose/mannose transport system permease protein